MPDRPVELGAVIVVLLAEFDKVFAGLRHQVAVQLEVQVAVVRHQPHVSLLLDASVPGRQKRFDV